MVSCEVKSVKAKQRSKVSILIQSWKHPKEDVRARETAVKSLLSCKVMETTWFKRAISEVKTWQGDKYVWNMVPSFPLKFPLLREIQNSMLLWSSLPFYGSGFPAPLVPEPTLCSELMFPRLSRICKISVPCFRMRLVTAWLQHNPHTKEASHKGIWKYITGKKHSRDKKCLVLFYLHICPHYIFILTINLYLYLKGLLF